MFTYDTWLEAIPECFDLVIDNADAGLPDPTPAPVDPAPAPVDPTPAPADQTPAPVDTTSDPPAGVPGLGEFVGEAVDDVVGDNGPTSNAKEHRTHLMTLSVFPIIFLLF